MYQLWKNFRNKKNFPQSKNFQIRSRKRISIMKTKAKTFTKKKLSPIVKSFARKPDTGKTPMPVAKKVDPLPLKGLKEYKLRFEPLPLPKPYREVQQRLSDWY